MVEEKVVRVDRNKPSYDNSCVTTIFPDTIFPSILDEKWGSRNFNLAEKLFKMTASHSHTIVTDTNGENVHRLITIDISEVQRMYGGQGQEILKKACGSLCSTVGNNILKHSVFQVKHSSPKIPTNQIVFPDFILALGGAQLMVTAVAGSLSDYWGVGKQSEINIPWIKLKKVTNDRNRLVGFKLRDEDWRYGKYLKKNSDKIFAVVFDDAALTTRSLVLVKDFADQLGINLIGVAVLFNQHGLCWPHVDIPIKVALANLPFEAYNDSNCPVCNPKKDGKKKKKETFNMRV